MEKQTEKQSEQRHSVRFRVPTLVKYKAIPHSTDYQAANIRNISLLGMAFLASRPVEKGAGLELHFLDPNGEALVVHGVVLHCTKITKNPDSFKVGVRFQELHAAAVEWLTKAEEFFLAVQKQEKG